MRNIIKKEIEWGGKKITIETGKIATHSDSSVLITCDKAVILVTVNAVKTVKEGVDFFPLVVNYLEKFYANGKIPGGFNKRESKPSETEILTSRLIDRAIRPLFPKWFTNETQVICTVLSYDANVDLSVLSIIGASTALSISSLPFSDEPLAAVRISKVASNLVIQPNEEDLQASDFDILIAATASSLLMVESKLNEVDYNDVLEAIKYGRESIAPICDFIQEYRQECGVEKMQESCVIDNYAEIKEAQASISQLVGDFISDKVKDICNEPAKKARNLIRSSIKKEALTHFKDNNAITGSVVDKEINSLEKKLMRQKVLEEKVRIDNRSPKDIRDITIEVGNSILPSVHGFAMFTRGETQSLVMTTIGSAGDEQFVETLGNNYSKNFMLDYNFPPYCVGEVSMLKSPGRREIGHGNLAYKSLISQYPSKKDFKLVVRSVSEITESNGSSSMATVCATSLSLMDAGVPVKNATAGIAMGLIKEGDDYVILSDILGDEDALGDMDFKVAATKNGVTALQMDIKTLGINNDILSDALSQAHEGVNFILDKMNNVLPQARESFNDNAPSIEELQIPVEKIKDIIGPSGKNIRKLCDRYSAKIDIDNDGMVMIFSTSKTLAKEAAEKINIIAVGVKIGTIHDGVVTNITDFGAFVEFCEDLVALIHISEFAEGRVENLHDLISLGDKVKFKVIGRDFKGKLRLSYKSVDQDTGEDLDPDRIEEDEYNPANKRRFNSQKKKPMNETGKFKRNNESNNSRNEEANEKRHREVVSDDYYNDTNEEKDEEDSEGNGNRKRNMFFWKK